jgi:competence protein ComFB
MMEDIVLKYLDDILPLKSDICKCEQCKNDIICYTLNRVKPMYAASSRGIIHAEKNKRVHIQDEIDVYSTLMEAIEVVSKSRRHEIKEEYKKINIAEDEIKPNYFSQSNCFYNFNVIVGRIFDSSVLKPISDAKVSLYFEDSKELVPMYSKIWKNPIEIVPQMEGTFTFWPSPIPAERSSIQKDFFMYIEIEKSGYDPVCKYFFVRLISNEGLIDYIKNENAYYLSDIFLSKTGENSNI